MMNVRRLLLLLLLLLAFDVDIIAQKKETDDEEQPKLTVIEETEKVHDTPQIDVEEHTEKMIAEEEEEPKKKGEKPPQAVSKKEKAKRAPKKKKEEAAEEAPEEEAAPTEDAKEEDAAQEAPEEEAEEPAQEEGAEEAPEKDADEQEAPKEKGVEPSKEEAIQEEAPPQPELGPEETMGIDTVDLEDPQGNWLYKRVWWERAEAKYEKIRTAVTSVLEVRTKFFARRSELDKNTLDPFYVKTGFNQGELQAYLTDRIVTLEKTIESRADVQLLESLEAEKQALEELRAEVQGVVKLDGEVENAIMMLVEQANKMRNYEQQAWQDFKNIARVLDDKKARELFYRVDGAWRNIQEIKQYIEGGFSTGFEQLINRVIQKVQQLDAQFQAMRERGIRLQRQQEEAQAEEEEEQAPPGFWARYVVMPITSFFKTIWNGITWPIRKLWGTEAPAQKEEQAASEDQAETTVEKPLESSAATAQPSMPEVPSSVLPTPPAVQAQPERTPLAPVRSLEEPDSEDGQAELLATEDDDEEPTEATQS